MNESRFLIVFLCLLLSSCCVPVVSSDSTLWYDSGFLYRNVYIIDSDLVDEALTDFPVLIYLNSSYVNWTLVNDDLSDLRFVSSDNVLLSHELDTYTVNDKAWIWVKIPSISNVVDTKFFMYYCSPSSESVEDKAGVWSNGFVGVWHMNDLTDSSVMDSLLVNNGTKTGSDEPLMVSSVVGSGQYFDGSSLIDCGNDSSLDLTSLTIQCWINTSDSGPWKGGLVSKSNEWDRSTASYILWRGADVDGMEFRGTGLDDTMGSLNIVSLFGLDSWINLVLTFNETDSVGNFYVDSVLNSSGTLWGVGALQKNELPLYFGASNVVNIYLDGVMDEIRLSEVVRSPSWVKADYYSQSLQLVSLSEIDSFLDETVYAERGEILATGIVISFILIPLLIIVLAALIRRKR